MSEDTPLFCSERLINKEFRSRIFYAEEQVWTVYLDVVVDPRDDAFWYEVHGYEAEPEMFDKFDDALAAFKALL